ncbi:MAG: hypothetical protein VXY93_21605, partial [Pseudomonadota bacterium]|nr:hypothetical protein [Pseudomonadota bacterium]
MHERVGELEAQLEAMRLRAEKAEAEARRAAGMARGAEWCLDDELLKRREEWLEEELERALPEPDDDDNDDDDDDDDEGGGVMTPV